jgi:hypothetical protein
MANCRFENVSWVFEGPAANTLAFLQALYHGMGEGGRKLVDDTFENIRRAYFTQLSGTVRVPGPILKGEATVTPRKIG